eukprot:COSAG01_NODE_34836_length_541_cov_1.011312_1_plen_62_part_01
MAAVVAGAMSGIHRLPGADPASKETQPTLFAGLTEVFGQAQSLMVRPLSKFPIKTQPKRKRY